MLHLKITVKIVKNNNIFGKHTSYSDFKLLKKKNNVNNEKY